MANKVNKLYIAVNNAGPVTIGATPQRVLAFPVTQAASNTVSADKYGRFLKDYEAMSLSDPSVNRAKKQVTAWFQASPGVSVGELPDTVASGFGCLIDFIAATGVATTALGIDPTLTRHFRVRAIINRLLTSAEFARNTLNGTIFVQRQHSIEV